MTSAHSMRLRRRSHGYTLVEVAVVMAVIGLLLGGLSIAKDMIREAEYKRIYKFAADWKRSYDLYYTRSGVVLGDNQLGPTFMVNGAESRIDNADGRYAGVPENYTNTGFRVCRGQGYPNNTVGAGDVRLAAQDLHSLFERIGIRMPAGRAEGQEDRYVYEDSNGNPVELQICFQWNPPKTISGSGNVMVLRGLTPDLARKLDQMIDGKPDALEGRFRQQNPLSNDQQPSRRTQGLEWAANNTYQQGGLNPTPYGVGEARDEDQVVLLTAHWAMDQ